MNSTIMRSQSNMNTTLQKKGSKENLAQVRYKDYIKDYFNNPDISEKKFQETREKLFQDVCSSYQPLNSVRTEISNFNNSIQKSINIEEQQSKLNLKNTPNTTSEETKIAQELLKKTLFQSSSQAKISRGAFSPPKMGLDQQYLELLRRPSSQSTYSQSSQNVNNLSNLKQNVSSNMNNNSSSLKTVQEYKSNILVSTNNNSVINHSSQGALATSSSRIDRLAYEHLVLEEKKRVLSQLQVEQEMKQCTFQPNLSSNRSKSRNALLDANFQLTQSVYPNQVVQDFVKKQDIHLQKHDLMQKQMMNKSIEQLELTIQEKPTINKKSQKLAVEMNKENQSVIDRLYSSNQKQKPQTSKRITPHRQRERDDQDHLHNNQEQILFDEQNFFQPQISERAHNIIRNKRIDMLLYEDAQRRQKHQEELQQSRSRSKSNQNTTFNSMTQSQTTLLTSQIQTSSQNQLIIGFIKEFQSAVKTHLSSNEYYSSSQENSDTLIFVEMIQILKALRFIAQSTYETNKQHTEICSQIWNYLKGDQKGYILKRNLQLFLLAVMNIHDKKCLVPKIQNNNISNILQNHLNNTSCKLSDIKILDNFQSINSQSTYRDEKQFRSTNTMLKDTKLLNKSLKSQSQKSEITFDEIDNLTISQDEVYRIHQKLSLEKSPVQNQYQQLNSSKEFDNRSKSPITISKTSEILAQNKREKLLYEVKQKEPQRTTIDLASLLSYQKEKTKIEIEQLRRKNIEEELSQCTFKPQTILCSPLSRKMSQHTQHQDGIFNKKNSQPDLSLHRSYHLYSLAKPQINKRDKDIKDIQYERECDQCTFQPDLNIKRVNSPTIKQQKPYNIQAIQKNVERLYSARVQNKVKEILSNKGTTINVKKFKKIEETVQKSYKQSQLNQKQHNQKVMNDIGSDRNIQSFTHFFEQKQKSMPSLIPSQQKLKLEKDDLSIEPCSPQLSSLNDCLSMDSLHTYVNPSTSKKIVEQEERVPQLFVDVNIEEGKSARIIVYEGDKSEELSIEFARQFSLDESMRLKLKDLLDLQINSLLHKIEEASANEDEEEDDLDQLMYSRSGSKLKSPTIM